MAWEVYEKIVRRSTSPTLNISKLGRLSFNAAAAETLTKNTVNHVLLLWDKDAHKIGVKSVSKKEPRSYAVHYAAKNAHAGFAAKTFLHYICYDYSETRSFPCHWNEKEAQFEITIPVENFSTKPIQRFPREQGGRKGSATHSQAKATSA